MHKRIRELREHLKLSQTAFAERLGMTRSIVSNMELGLVEIPEYRINTIIKEFGVNRHWLETGEGEMLDPHSDQAYEQYPPIIRAVLKSYAQLNPNEQAAFCKFLDGVVAEYAGEILPPIQAPAIPDTDEYIRTRTTPIIDRDAQ